MSKQCQGADCGPVKGSPYYSLKFGKHLNAIQAGEGSNSPSSTTYNKRLSIVWDNLFFLV